MGPLLLSRFFLVGTTAEARVQQVVEALVLPALRLFLIVRVGLGLLRLQALRTAVVQVVGVV